MIVGITPARGGSKGVLKKNIKTLCGKPLLAWTIEAARDSCLLDEYVISTENSEIAEVAQKWGARVLWRPDSLATDETHTLPVLQHLISEIPADTVVLLQATSPVRDPGLIDRCVMQFSQTDADSLATGFMCKYVEYAKVNLRRQDIQGFFYDDGNVYVIRGDIIKAGDRYGERIERILLDRDQNVEIDDEYDFWLAEQVLKRRQELGLLGVQLPPKFNQTGA